MPSTRSRNRINRNRGSNILGNLDVNRHSSPTVVKKTKEINHSIDGSPSSHDSGNSEESSDESTIVRHSKKVTAKRRIIIESESESEEEDGNVSANSDEDEDEVSDADNENKNVEDMDEDEDEDEEEEKDEEDLDEQHDDSQSEDDESSVEEQECFDNHFDSENEPSSEEEYVTSDDDDEYEMESDAEEEDDDIFEFATKEEHRNRGKAKRNQRKGSTPTKDVEDTVSKSKHNAERELESPCSQEGFSDEPQQSKSSDQLVEHTKEQEDNKYKENCRISDSQEERWRESDMSYSSQCLDERVTAGEANDECDVAFCSDGESDKREDLDHLDSETEDENEDELEDEAEENESEDENDEVEVIAQILEDAHFDDEEVEEVIAVAILDEEEPENIENDDEQIPHQNSPNAILEAFPYKENRKLRDGTVVSFEEGGRQDANSVQRKSSVSHENTTAQPIHQHEDEDSMIDQLRATTLNTNSPGMSHQHEDDDIVIGQLPGTPLKTNSPGMSHQHDHEDNVIDQLPATLLKMNSPGMSLSDTDPDKTIKFAVDFGSDEESHLSDEEKSEKDIYPGLESRCVSSTKKPGGRSDALGATDPEAPYDLEPLGLHDQGEDNGASQRNQKIAHKQNRKKPTQKTHTLFVRPGKWTKGSRIGKGSYGVVHLGMNMATGTMIAVKSIQLEKTILNEIRQEVDVLKSLSHGNIVRYLGVERKGNTLHVFQEWVAGGSVTLLLKKFGPFSAEVMRSYVSQILTGLSFLHENNILHRDIKGGNVLVSNEGVVKLADFGSSKRMAHAKTDMMKSLTMRGTPYFMAPEVFEQNYGGKADIWGIGCVAFQMATGFPPWKQDNFTNPMSLFLHLRESTGPPNFEWPADGPMRHSEKTSFMCMLDQCFRRNPKERPTALELSTCFFLLNPVHTEDDCSSCTGLFSLDTHSKASTFTSPQSNGLPPRTPNASGTPKTPNTPVLSPPLQKIQASRRFSVSPLKHSPVLESKGWPKWAQEKVPTKLNYSSGKARPAVDDSLAYSTDSASIYPAVTKTSTTKMNQSSSSNLDGLRFLERSTR